MSESIFSIDDVTITLEKNGAHILSIRCAGTASTPGWTDVTLSPYVYLVPPEDGIQDFGLIGDPPTGIVIQVLSPVSCERQWRVEGWLKGVRVHAASNSLVTML